MTAPRVAIDPGKIRRNTRFLVERLRTHGITVTRVTKAVCSHPGLALTMPDGGTIGLAVARVVNVRRKRDAGLTCLASMVRGPLQSEIEDVVQYCDSSYNTEIDTIQRLAVAAHKLGKTHDVLLMLEEGGVREGILPENITALDSQLVATPGVALRGIATHFAWLGDAAPQRSIDRDDQVSWRPPAFDSGLVFR